MSGGVDEATAPVGESIVEAKLNIEEDGWRAVAQPQELAVLGEDLDLDVGGKCTHGEEEGHGVLLPPPLDVLPGALNDGEDDGWPPALDDLGVGSSNWRIAAWARRALATASRRFA